MPRNSAIAAASLAVSMAYFGPFSEAQALPAAELPILQDNQLQHAGFNRCNAWADKCAWRWGIGTWRFARCLRRHGC
jgi:hypothetical protein